MFMKRVSKNLSLLLGAALVWTQLAMAQTKNLQAVAWDQYYLGDYKGAIASFTELLEKGPAPAKKDLWSVHLALGYSYHFTKQNIQAKRHFAESNDNKENFDAYRGLGLVEFDSKNYKEASSQFAKSLKLNTNQYDLRSLIAWCAFKDGDMDKAATGFKNQIILNPYVADAHYGMAMALHKKGDKKGALYEFYSTMSLAPGYLLNPEFLQVLDATSDYKNLYRDLGWALYFANIPKDSFDMFERGLKKDADSRQMLHGLCYASYKLGKFDAAIENCQKTLAKKPDVAPILETVYDYAGSYSLYSDPQTTMAWSYFKKNDLQTAQAEFQKALKTHPDWPDANSGLGWVYYSLKRYSEAEESFNRAIKIDPKYLDAYSGLTAIANAKLGKTGEGWRLFYIGQYQKAIESFTEELNKPNVAPEAKLQGTRGLGWCHLRLKNFAEAEKHFRSLAANAQDFDAKLGLGYTLYYQNNFSEATKSLKEAIKAFPFDVDAEIVLGWSYYKTNNYADSLIEFRRAAQLNPYLAEPLRGIGLSLAKVGRLEEAKSNLMAAINMYPQGSDTNELAELMNEKKEFGDLLITQSWAYYNFGQFAKASQKVEAIKQKKLNYADIDLLAGYVHYKEKKYTEATQELSGLLGKMPQKELGFGKYSEVLNTLGWAHYELKNYAEAIKSFEKLLVLHKADDYWAAPYDGMGWAYLKLADKDKANKMFTKSLQLAPGYVSSLAGLSELKKK